MFNFFFVLFHIVVVNANRCNWRWWIRLCSMSIIYDYYCCSYAGDDEVGLFVSLSFGKVIIIFLSSIFCLTTNCRFHCCSYIEMSNKTFRQIQWVFLVMFRLIKPCISCSSFVVAGELIIRFASLLGPLSVVKFLLPFFLLLLCW